jgi:WD40 repeat protein
VFLLVSLLAAGCNRFGGSSGADAGEEVPKHAPAGDPASLPKISADENEIRKMLRERFGDVVARTIRVEVEDQGGKRVSLSGEVPSEEIRQAVMKELEARVQDMKTEDFTLTVAGPIRMVFGFDARTAVNDLAAFSPDLSLVITGDGNLYETATGRRLNRLDLEGRNICSIAFSPDGKLLALGFHGTGIRLFDMPLGATSRTLVPFTQALTGDPNIAGLAFTPDGQQLVSVNSDHGVLSIWDLSTGKGRTIGSHVPSDSPRNLMSRWVLAVSPDGGQVAAASFDETAISLWDIASRSRVKQFDAEPVNPLALAWSHNGKYIAVGRGTGDRRGPVLFEVATGKATVFARDRDDIINAVAFSPDDRTLAADYTDSGVVMWDLATGKEWQTIDSAKVSAGVALRFSPDGALLATDCSAIRPPGFRLWDVARRPGGGRAGARLPATVPVAAVRDDRMMRGIEHAIMANAPRTIRDLHAELQPDGSIVLTGRAYSAETARSAVQTAQWYHLGEDVGDSSKNRIINQLQVDPSIYP